MTPTNDISGPDQETDPAFALPTRRNFDGGLLDRWPYTITKAEALAVLRLPRPLPRWQRLSFGATFLGWGALVALLPDTQTGGWGSPRFVMLLAGGAAFGALVLLTLRGLYRQRLAHQIVPFPRPGVMEEWIDCIAVTRLDGNEEDYLSPELIGAVTLTRRHLFIHGPDQALVVPISAFGDRAAALAVARHIANLSKGPYYFDAQD